MYLESKARPHWIDKKTLAFKIPFGEWDISYSFLVTVVDRNYKNTARAESVHVTISKDHPIAKIKSKMKLFGYKLIEII